MILTSDYDRVRLEWMIAIVQTILEGYQKQMRAAYREFLAKLDERINTAVFIIRQRQANWRKN